MRKLCFTLIAVLLFLISISVAAQQNTLPNLPGQVAFVGTDYNIYSRHFNSDEIFQLSDDASPNRHYQWPTWSTDGRLAYFCCDLQFARDLDAQAYISADGQQEGVEAYSGRGETVIYAYWSPSTCGDDNCRDLAMLVNNVVTGGLAVSILRDTASDTTVEPIGVGSPFYYSWSPNGNQLAMHRNNRQLDIYDLEADDITTNFDQRSSGAFQAPAWSPVDDRIIFGVRGEERGMTDLVIATPTTSEVLVEDIEGNVSFAWSPDGNYVAYRVISESEFGALFILDAITGEVVSRSSVSGVIAFFWAPDSSHVAYLTLATPAGTFNADANFGRARAALVQQPNGLAWSTVNIENGLNRRYSSFLPTSEMVYMLVYFDQFAQSHQVWSPDSTHLVYTELASREPLEPVVSILDVTQPDTVPLTIAEGVFAIWSFE